MKGKSQESVLSFLLLFIYFLGLIFAVPDVVCATRDLRMLGMIIDVDESGPHETDGQICLIFVAGHGLSVASLSDFDSIFSYSSLVIL